ncbi:cell surface protein SprA [Paludibacter sp. 221]|uniref:T9SS outer membrane translocon Sov/SprA n=1 Tax=Paludibacter sp. 221 TaxID=2302939 RepID=UPI0013D084ED|nr:cell surface protein SprA [Paludibacter sp. 221]NDV45728.1 cell surface protein SprA [Paludibacter sp. 221]
MQNKILSIFIISLFVSLFLLPMGSVAQQSVNQADTTKTRFPISNNKQDTFEDLDVKHPMDAPMPENVKSVVEYDPVSGLYIMRTYVGNTEIATPYSMTEQEYYDYSAKKAMNRYWLEKDSDGERSNEDKFSLTDMKFNIGAADKIFGPGGVQIKTQGSAELLFGITHTNLQNPSVSKRLRRNTSPDFDQKIQLNVNAKVGTRLNFGMNYNTQSSFGFDQKMVKLGFKGEEDDIIQNIEAGNVSMPLNSSLISGSTSLFGVKTDLKFGKLSVSAIATQQQSESQSVSSRGGAQTTEFDISIDNYDENRHFFLAHYFRDKFEGAMSRLPNAAYGVTINRLEVWVTNKRGNYEQARNIVAFMDLAEKDSLAANYWKLPVGGDALPGNKSNNLYNVVKDIDGIRDIQRTNQVLADYFAINAPDVRGGEDYEKVESARRLEASEYTFNPSLGIISLRSALNPDEVLAVAFEYTYNGETYQVGEFSTDNIQAPNTLIVKMLKGTVQIPQLPMWDLMMKNVYYLNTFQLQPDNFRLDIVYRNDSIGTDLQYITEGDIKNKILLRVMNLDRLDKQQRKTPDGKFDYVEGYTVSANTGRVIFPVLEPFGKHLEKEIGNSQIARNYVFKELYDSTLVIAREFSEKNKFRLVGEYQASSGKEIRLNAMNIPRGSVSVTAGGETLVENVDYTVDYTMGTVSILRESLLESGTNIDVKLENQSMFSMQRKSLFGTHVEYEFSKNFTLGGTVMHLSETPLTTKVNTGSEPISNTIWGLNTSWRGESQWLTNVIDKLPFVNATQPSSFAVNAEFAQLIPGHSKAIGDAGYAYVDDFEATKTNINLNYSPAYYWKLASTPSVFPESARSNDVSYGYNRALLAWYSVDPNLNISTKNTPAHLRDNPDLQSNHLTRNVLVEEIYPNRETLTTQSNNLSVMNLSFYPTERGPYNLNWQGMNPDGSLQNPKSRWGGVMRKLDVTDFENANIEYIEFWMMDPFVNDSTGTHLGGKLVFNLGDISEDVLKDGKKFFENGLSSTGDVSQNDETVWGYVPRGQSTVNAFDNTPGARIYQDVGLNGLTSEQEKSFGAYKEFLDNLRNILDPNVQARMDLDPFSPFNDPAGDSYHFYRGSDYDDQELDVLSRYKRYNGTEGNSPEIADTNETYATNSTTLPDTEDINADNTMNEYEKYFEYAVDIKRESMQIGQNYITERKDVEVTLRNGQPSTVTWYQFKIPVASGERKGNIRNFKSIRFMRMYLTDFEDDITLRFATLDLVRGEWRTYTKALHEPDKMPESDGKLDVLAVNIEENATKSPVNYVLPPGINRQTTPGQTQIIAQNEQAMVLRVRDLSPNDARAVYKKTNYDMRQYKRLQMYVHAEALESGEPLEDQQLSCFVRLGTDMTDNYYEYEIPLVLTPEGRYDNSLLNDRRAVWPEDNKFDFPFEVLTDAKLLRNKAKQNPASGVTNLTLFETWDPEKPKNKITVRGNPTLSEVKNIMIGIRNKSNSLRTGEIWVNELRMSEFDESGGWAAMANMALALSDIATVNVAGRTETAGFGSIESKVMDRRMDDLYQISVSTSVDAGRFLPEKAKLQIPIYFSYSNETLSPKYNPLDEDILLSDALDNLETEQQRDSLKMMSNTVATSKSFNVSNAKVNIRSKKPQFYDPANITVTYAYVESNKQSADIEKDMVKEQRAAINYSYSFSSQPFEPFKNVKALDKPAFKIIKDMNIYYTPTSLSFNTDMNRQFSQVKLRDFSAVSATEEPMDLTFAKDFVWRRQFNIAYNLTRAISLTFNAATNANIIEPYYTPEIGKEHYELWRDSVWMSVKEFGRASTYQQTFTASWNLPVNKIPILSWVNLNASYNANYSWNRVEEESMGNIATSMGAWQGGGQFNFEQLYNKSKYLKGVDTRMKQTGNRPKFQPKTYTETVSLKGGESKTINHRLGSDRLQVSAVDKSGKPVRVSQGAKNNNSVDITTPNDADEILLTVVSQDPNHRNPAQQIADYTVRGLMMVRRASFTYRESNNMTIPGFMQEPSFLGQRKDHNGIYAPGIGFAFGFFDEDSTLDKMKQNGWLLANNDTIVNPAIFSHSSELDVKVSVEPIVGFKIELNAKQVTQYNKSTLYMSPGSPTTFTGNYNITQVAIGTAFRKVGNGENNYRSETYETFRANREVIRQRLNREHQGKVYPNDENAGFLTGNNYGQYDPNTYGGYSENSADVLIPAFLAAYTGRDVNTVGTNPLLSLLSILPNWRVTYDGLTRIPWIKDRFRTVNLTHGYTCRYTVGAYSSYSTWVPMESGSDFGYIRNVENDFPIPSMQYEIPSVSLVEQFSPLIGVNVTMKNSMTTKIEYRKQRNLSLNLASAQLADGSSDEIVFGFGYTIKDFNVILKMKDRQSKVKNDLKLNVDVSYRDNKMLLRKIEENITQATSGNKMFGVKVMADYVFSSKINLQMFFDHQGTTPLISSSFPVSTTNFGLGIKFMLTR